MSLEDDPLAFVARVVGEAGLRSCLIGGHAVNVWVEPRFTADIDLTVLADRQGLLHLQHTLVSLGYRVVLEVGAELPSGPDFVRFARGVDDPPLDLQAAKTAFQVQIIDRAQPVGHGPAVATPEDLIVLKLIAHRPKDLGDLRNLLVLPSLDCATSSTGPPNGTSLIASPCSARPPCLREGCLRRPEPRRLRRNRAPATARGRPSPTAACA